MYANNYSKVALKCIDFGKIGFLEKWNFAKTCNILQYIHMKFIPILQFLYEVYFEFCKKQSVQFFNHFSSNVEQK